MRFFPKKYQLAKQKFDKVLHLNLSISIKIVLKFFYLGSLRVKILSFERENMCYGCCYENAITNDKIIFR